MSQPAGDNQSLAAKDGKCEIAIAESKVDRKSGEVQRRAHHVHSACRCTSDEREIKRDQRKSEERHFSISG